MLVTTAEGNQLQLLHDGEACLSAMLAAIEQASHEILLEMYWFGSDATGRRFATALSERARAGVRVCVTFDAVGSFESDRAMFDEMRAAGCGVYEFRPLRFFSRRFSFARFNRRNHRKVLVIDGCVGFTGGVNLADPWAAIEHGGLGFRDDMVRIAGPAVLRMREIVLTTYRGPHKLAALEARLPAAGPLQRGALVHVLTNQGRAQRRVIERAYIDHIRRARRSVLITNSYFIPGRKVRLALASAVRRGVEVRVLLPVESDVPAVMYATHRLYAWLLKRGIALHEWGHSILHSKTAVIDGEWSTVGTHNLDHRSWAYNLEINVTIEDPSFAKLLEARMRADIETSVQVDARNWSFRPLGERLLEVFFYWFRRLL